MLFRSQVVALVESGILVVCGDHLMEEEYKKLRQSHHPQVPFEVYRILSVVACCLQKETVVRIQKHKIITYMNDLTYIH